MPTMSLLVALTDEDRLKIQKDDLTPAIKALEDVEAEKKAAVKDFNVDIKRHKETIKSLNDTLASGTVLRDVEIEERPDWEAGIRYVWRLDTNECVKQIAIDPDERQIKMGLPTPGTVLDGGATGETANTDEQRDASSPEEAEQLRAERLANERAERISAAVTEARGHIVITTDPEAMPGQEVRATLQHGNRVFEATGNAEETARAGVEVQLVEHLEAEEADRKPTWAEVAAASKAEQDRQEVERLAAEQAEDDKQTKKRTLKVGAGDGLKNGGLKAPRLKREKKAGDGIIVTDNDGNVLARGREGEEGEPPTPGDDGPVATGREGANGSDTTPPEGCAF